MTETPSPKIQKLVDPETGQAVHLVYAIPPELLGEQTGGDQGLSLSDLLARLRGGWKWIAGGALLGGLIGVVIALLLPNQYTSSVTALPPGKDSNLAQYAQLATLAGVSLPSGPTSSADEIMAILDSRRLRVRLIEEFDLLAYYHATVIDDALLAFAEDFAVRQDKRANRITFAATNKDPAQAHRIAARTSELLQSVFNEIHQSTARRERTFLEGRYEQAMVELKAAAEAMAAFQREHHTFEIGSQTTATVEAIAKLQGELIAQQVELRALLASTVNEDNPKVKLVQERVLAMADQLDRLVGTGDREGGGVLMGLGGLPELAVLYLDKLRAVKRGESLTAAIITQLEAARVNEVREAEAVVIVDPAAVPGRKSRPARSNIVLIFTLLGAMSGAGYVALRRFGPGLGSSVAAG